MLLCFACSARTDGAKARIPNPTRPPSVRARRRRSTTCPVPPNGTAEFEFEAFSICFVIPQSAFFFSPTTHQRTRKAQKAAASGGGQRPTPRLHSLSPLGVAPELNRSHVCFLAASRVAGVHNK